MSGLKSNRIGSANVALRLGGTAVIVSVSLLLGKARIKDKAGWAYSSASLPNAPDAVDLCVVEPEQRIARRGEEVVVDARDERVAGCMGACKEDALEGADVGQIDQHELDDVPVGRHLQEGVVEVADDWTRVVPQSVWPRVWRHVLAVVVRVQHRPKVLLPVDDRPIVDVAAAGPRRSVDADGRRIGRQRPLLDRAIAIGDVLAVAGERGHGAIVQRIGGGGQGGPVRPLPVRLVALVAALVAHCLLIQPEEMAVPGEEVGGAVDDWGVEDVGGLEVVEPRSGPRDQRRVEDGGSLGHTLQRVDVVPPLPLAEIAPVLPRAGIAVGKGHKEGENGPDKRPRGEHGDDDDGG
ncbi:uncharacterized protein DSM5745_00007 [Aspergillus mulundensis]|uniref:Uncharacterized protein n=1 Tax=Aspergillus mulundensis TaxID=1810919 RepID=A0A3D8T287_9EURO|nr:hypothetical protein DSM5745_00007 [Aspergillus mulundensis]RDW92685.1 hypothetical protein DSM5745_00007 [Aspergillus mulundensis]